MCDNTSNGCNWIGELGVLEKHTFECNYALLPCPNKCSVYKATPSARDNDKIFHVLRKDMDKHVSEECPRREYECPHCSERGEYQVMTTTHLDECDFIEVPCPNEGCYESIVRKVISEHRTVCEFETVSCKYKTIGCEVEVLRRDLEKHENNSQHHLQCAIDTVHKHETTTRKRQENVIAQLQSVILSQSKEISELRSKLDNLSEMYHHPLCKIKIYYTDVNPSDVDNDVASRQKSVFKFNDFAKLKSCSKFVYSPPLYSSPGGYKMCFKVIPDGNGIGKGSHVAVYAFLMRGENDSHLSWPFTGKVVMELLNQLEDKNHYLISVEFRDNIKSSERVVDGELAKAGYGRPCFIPHSSLDYNAAKNCQYLKDDSLYFRFKIECPPAAKPWLSPANIC